MKVFIIGITAILLFSACQSKDEFYQTCDSEKMLEKYKNDFKIYIRDGFHKSAINIAIIKSPIEISNDPLTCKVELSYTILLSSFKKQVGKIETTTIFKSVEGDTLNTELILGTDYSQIVRRKD